MSTYNVRTVYDIDIRSFPGVFPDNIISLAGDLEDNVEYIGKVGGFDRISFVCSEEADSFSAVVAMCRDKVLSRYKGVSLIYAQDLDTLTRITGSTGGDSPFV